MNSGIARFLSRRTGFTLLPLRLGAGILGVLVSVHVAGCNRSAAETQPPEATPAAVYKAGHGLQLTPLAREFVGLATADFKERLPAAALLRTVQGDFVYVENEGWFLRTPVRLGARDADAGSFVIEDGLYEGDQVVTHGVRAVWLAELHFLRAGQACAHGGG